MTAHTPSVSSESEQQPSHFVGGLALGMVLGVAGYYFFGTTQGKKHREVLLRKWQRFSIESAATQVRHTAQQGWSQGLLKGLRSLAAELGVRDWQPPKEELTKTKPSSTIRSTVAPARQKEKTSSRARFRGV